MIDTNRRYGLCQHRLELNSLEKRFSDIWNFWMLGTGELFCDNTLKYILAEDEIPILVDDQTKDIVAIIIQWLGSPIGQGFLREVMEGEEWIQIVGTG